MKVLRTPDERFDGLPDFPYEPNYLMVPDSEGGGLRIHYVDEGSKDAEPVLMMHGEPSWSFLYRKMISIFLGAGYRAVAPDLVGFGRSANRLTAATTPITATWSGCRPGWNRRT